ncbi:hypothetical protein LFZ25_25480 (plasmid) [Salmonella enterica subsp. enterica serovar Macclesfield str. S-1643]|uniref:Uncharacterized protein n=1 Tax=Salmonella enterica subsp. enterica serovar Macclesfield str. S-1643 TaxID=1242107 RepID=A0A241PXT3_SALET|nr:hypothetical protein LFZ25_25480 [Salmonella enterica subsp. enterica serovar Macclesfield str. S-1643]
MFRSSGYHPGFKYSGHSPLQAPCDIAPHGYLTDGFFLKFRCKSWCAHTLLLCSNYRAGSSTGVGSVQL